VRTYRREKPDKIVWQPRIYYWYNGRRETGAMPQRYQGKSMLEVYDELGASPRYPAEVLGISVYRLDVDDTVKLHVRQEGREITRTHETPVGSLREVVRKGSIGSGGYRTEHLVKTPDDMKIMMYILDHTEFIFDTEAFERAEEVFGDRGIVQSHYPRSPLQRLIINYMGLDNTIFALNDYPRRTLAFLKAIEEWDDVMYDRLLDSPMQILNLGENIDANIDSPRLYEEYLLPYYKKRVEQIHQKGKFCHIHMDGSLKPLLPLIREAGFDGIEAATPLPQGDVTIEEIKEALGDTILLDGIPAVIFLPSCSDEELEQCTQKILDTFAPNLIIGISDELPPPADIEKLRLVSRIVNDYEVQHGE